MKNGETIDVTVDDGIDLLRDDFQSILQQMIEETNTKAFNSKIDELDVKSLRTLAQQRQPGAILAPFVGGVFALLLLVYMLRRDSKFIQYCDRNRFIQHLK